LFLAATSRAKTGSLHFKSSSRARLNAVLLARSSTLIPSRLLARFSALFLSTGSGSLRQYDSIDWVGSLWFIASISICGSLKRYDSL
jgi:hypothetical protein